MCCDEMKDSKWEYKKCCGCKEGPQGVAGLQGQQGIQGVAGQNGAQGAQGPMGLTGMQGPQGLQGPPGKDCEASTPVESCCCDRFANVYSSVSQSIGAFGSPNDAVLFDKQNAVSSGDFDLSMLSVTGDIKFLKHGFYDLQWHLQARIQPPVPQPVPSWAFAFWKNGVLVPGSINSGFSQSPNDGVVPSAAEVIVEVFAGDVLRLRSASSSSVDLNPTGVGVAFPLTIASISIMCVKAMA